MACASCGGGRQLTPNVRRNDSGIVQSPNNITVRPNVSRGGGAQVRMTPNEDPQNKSNRVKV